MLIIKYDPIKGKTVPDGFIKDWANNILKKYDEFKAIKIDGVTKDAVASGIVKEKTVIMNVTVGSLIVIDATRILIMKKKLNYKEVLYRFKGQNLKVDKNGKLSTWPKGFCDIYDDMLEELVSWKN